MKILITGANGMVGKNLTDLAPLSKHSILTPKRNELNLFNKEEVNAYLNQHKPEMIIHCAGRVGGIQANVKFPVEFLVENVDINRNLIGAALDCGVKKFINLSSSCTYPRNAPNPLREEQILTGELEPTNEGYALAKIFAMKFCEYINRTHPDFSYKTIIPCNLYGKHDKFSPQSSHLVPAIIHKVHQAVLAKSDTVEIWGSGEARREFMYAGDLAQLIWNMVDNFDSCPELMNVGLGFDHSINDYYRAACEVIGFKGSFQHDLTKPVGMKQKLTSIDRLEKYGWKAPTSLKKGLELTYKFYLENEA